MANTIETLFFFLHRQIEGLKKITFTKKVSYIIAPLLPIFVTITSVYLMITVSWLFVFFIIVSLPLAFMLTIASYNFLKKGQNIFTISHSDQILRHSLRSYNSNNESIPYFFTRKPIEFKLKKGKENIVQSKFDTKSFSESQLKAILNAYNVLNKEIISDETTYNDFINAIKQMTTKDANYNESIIKLQIPSENCAYFLQSFFIPFLKKVTGTNATLLSIHNFFLFSISNEYRPLNYDSITKNSRKLSTSSQRNTYFQILENINKSVNQE